MAESALQQETWVSKLLSQAKSAAGITIIISVVAAVISAFDTGGFTLVNTIVTGGMWALLAIGLSLLFGVMNIVNFAHGELFMVGTLVAYFVFTPLSDYLKDNPSPFLSMVAPLVAILAATIVVALVGLAWEFLAFAPLRKRTHEQWVMNTFLLTVGLSVVMVNGVQLIWGTNFKGITRYWDVPPIKLGDVIISVDRAVVFVLAIVMIGAFWVFLRRTQTGRAIRAVAQDEQGALMVGVDLKQIQILTAVLSAAMAGMAGGSLLFMFQSYPTVGLKPLYIAWYVVIVVGLGNVAAAIFGGFIVALLQTLTSYYIGVGWEDVIPTAFMMLILLIKPSGLFGSEVKGVHEQ
jgi:branched-chain amino acid transport system permease protein